MPKKQKPLCKFYQSSKGCKFGSSCKFRHEEINFKPHAQHHVTGFAAENIDEQEPDMESFMRNSFPHGAPPFPLFLQMMMNSMQLDDQDDDLFDEDEFDEEFDDDEDEFEEDEFDEDEDLFPGNNFSFNPLQHQDAVRFLLSQMNQKEDTSDEEEEEEVSTPPLKPFSQRTYQEDTTIVEEEEEIFSLQAQPPFCATCGKRFSTKEEAKQHMIEAGHWFCPQCGMNFKSSVLYLAHRDARHLSAESQDYIIYLQNDPFAETFKNAHPIQTNLCMRLLCNIYLNYGLPLWKETDIQTAIKKIIDQIFMHELTIRAIREQPFPLPHYLEFSDMMFNPSSPFKANQEYKLLHKKCQESFAKVFKQYVQQSNSQMTVLKMTRTERTRFVSSNYFQAWIHHSHLSQWSKNTNDTIQVSHDVVLGWDADLIAAQKLNVPQTAPTQKPQTSQKPTQPPPTRNNNNNHTATKKTAPPKTTQGIWELSDEDDPPQIAKKSTRSPVQAPQNDNASKPHTQNPSTSQTNANKAANQNQSTASKASSGPAFNFTPPGFPTAQPVTGKPFGFTNEPPKSSATSTSTPSVATKSSSPAPVKPSDSGSELGPCLSCGKPASSRCARCKAASYCSAACQKAHWGTHKKTCGTADTSKTNSAKTADSIWYASLDKKQIYQRFIDSYRLRVEDDYVWGANTHGLYASEDPLPDFKKYLAKAKQAKVMPAWWKPENDQEMIEMATNDEWANINFAVEKSDITDHYGFGEHLILRHLGLLICGDF